MHKIVILIIILHANAYANITFAGKECNGKNIEDYFLEDDKDNKSLKNRVDDAKQALAIFNKYKWDVYFLASEKDLEIAGYQLKPFLPDTLKIALEMDIDLTCWSKSCSGASALQFNTYDHGVICMNNKILATSKNFYGAKKDLPKALNEKYGKPIENKVFKISQTQRLSSPTKERILKSTKYQQGSISIIHLNDISYQLEGENYETNTIYYLDEDNAKSIYLKLKKNQNELKTFREKKNIEYEKDAIKKLKDKI